LLCTGKLRQQQKQRQKKRGVESLTSFIVKREVVCMRLEEHSIKQERILQKQKNMIKLIYNLECEPPSTIDIHRPCTATPSTLVDSSVFLDISCEQGGNNKTYVGSLLRQ
jgi:hypothetical protein